MFSNNLWTINICLLQVRRALKSITGVEWLQFVELTAFLVILGGCYELQNFKNQSPIPEQIQLSVAFVLNFFHENWLEKFCAPFL